MATSKVRAKMLCGSVERNGDTYSIRLSPVVGDGSEENASFYAATPGGVVILEVVSEGTAKHFEQGEEYYLDFTHVKATSAK